MRITVAAEQLEIVVRSADEVTSTIVVPVQLKRSGLAVRLIVRGPDQDRARGPDARLVGLLVKAQRWFAMLRSGDRPSVLAIAQEYGLASADVTKVIYLAFLAPDIVQCIVRGEHPIGLGTKKLLAIAPLPLDWNEQRRVLGFR